MSIKKKKRIRKVKNNNKEVSEEKRLEKLGIYTNNKKNDDQDESWRDVG